MKVEAFGYNFVYIIRSRFYAYVTWEKKKISEDENFAEI